MHTVKPIDKVVVYNTAKTVNALATIEEHSVIGGLGSAVAEVIAEGGTALPFKRFGIDDTFTTKIDKQSRLLKFHGLTAHALADWLASQVKRTKA